MVSLLWTCKANEENKTEEEPKRFKSHLDFSKDKKTIHVGKFKYDAKNWKEEKEIEKDLDKTPMQRALDTLDTNNPTKQSILKKDNPLVCFDKGIQGLLDVCGVCNGKNDTCSDCRGIINGPHVKDRTKQKCCLKSDINPCDGLCFGKTVKDCNKECKGEAYMSDCNICVGGRTGKYENNSKDCNGDCFGSAYINKCEYCVLGKTNVPEDKGMGCDEVCGSSKKMDECEICGGNGKSCKDCNGVRFDQGGDSSLKTDICGKCAGDNSTCSGCDGIPWSGKEIDLCGQCGGENKCCGEDGNCNEHGICSSKVKGCICNDGYAGPFCNIERVKCLGKECGLNGQCSETTGQCVCEPGWIGEKCNLKSCSSHGLFNTISGECDCFEGYNGINCDTCENPPEGHTHVCILSKEMYFKKPTGGFDKSGPLKFVHAMIKSEDLWPVLRGTNSLSKGHDRLVILPATKYDSYVYGCDCLPAIPFVDLKTEDPLFDFLDTLVKSDKLVQETNKHNERNRYNYESELMMRTGLGLEEIIVDSPYISKKKIPGSDGNYIITFKIFSDQASAHRLPFGRNLPYFDSSSDPLVPVYRKIEQYRENAQLFSRSLESTQDDFFSLWRLTMIVWYITYIIIFVTVVLTVFFVTSYVIK